MKLQLIYIKNEVISKYQEVEPRVLNNMKNNNQRPYFGLLFKSENNKFSWAIPLASPSQNKISKNLANSPFVFLIKENEKVLGLLQINNMIPVNEKMYDKIDFKKLDSKYANLLKKEMRIIKSNKNEIFSKVNETFKEHKKQREKPQLCDLTRLVEKFEVMELEQTQSKRLTKPISFDR